MILVDSCVLIDVINRDPTWFKRSLEALDAWSRRGPVLINPVVYAVVSPEFDAPAVLDALLDEVGLELREIPREALFLAARAHQAYRRRGGLRAGVLSDFFIGAHAVVLELPVLTRDTRRFASCFPSLRLVMP
jgi:predicted nucleic acid-binding protein